MQDKVMRIRILAHSSFCGMDFVHVARTRERLLYHGVGHALQCLSTVTGFKKKATINIPVAAMLQCYIQQKHDLSTTFPFPVSFRVKHKFITAMGDAFGASVGHCLNCSECWQHKLRAKFLQNRLSDSEFDILKRRTVW